MKRTITVSKKNTFKYIFVVGFHAECCLKVILYFCFFKIAQTTGHITDLGNPLFSLSHCSSLVPTYISNFVSGFYNMNIIIWYGVIDVVNDYFMVHSPWSSLGEVSGPARGPFLGLAVYLERVLFFVGSSTLIDESNYLLITLNNSTDGVETLSNYHNSFSFRFSTSLPSTLRSRTIHSSQNTSRKLEKSQKAENDVLPLVIISICK